MLERVVFTGCLIMSISSLAETSRFIPADDKRLEFSDYAKIEFYPNPSVKEGKIARMYRPIGSSGTIYRWDNPGARLRFRTNAKKAVVHLLYSDKHKSRSARKPVGIYLIDGKSSEKWKFTSNTEKVVRPVESLDLNLDVPGDNTFHDYEIIMPYGDSVDIGGLTVNHEAKLQAPSPRSGLRCAIYGDSVTQGFTAESIEDTYAFRLVQKKKWQLINLGIGGRSSNPNDGTVIGNIKCDILIVLMGVNDWQGGKQVNTYKKNMQKFIRNFRKIQKDTPVWIITPLWVPPSWKPKRAKYKLDEYRQVLRDIVNDSPDPNLKLIEGPELIDHDEKYFDRVAVHPNNAGFKMMSERLSKIFIDKD